MKVLFISSCDSNFYVMPFVKSQEDSIRNNGVEVDHFLIDEKGVIGYLKNIYKLRKYLKAFQYDIIHAHYSFAGWVARLAAPVSSIVVSFMGSDVQGSVDIKGKKKGYIGIISSMLLQPFVDKIILKSKNLEKYIYIKKKSVIIPNGVDFETFKPRDKKEARKKLNLPQDKKIIIFLGNPNEYRKNILLIKEALNNINDNNIILINPFPVLPNLVPYYLNAGDTLVLTSYLEGSPNVIKEGMASNIPIVSTNVGDVAEIISSSEGCFLCSFYPNDVAEKIIKALTYTQGTNGRENITHLELNVIAKKIIILYNEVLRRNKQSAMPDIANNN